ncbi:hypothetical protein pb186bvf_015322 [Paramecium bursaria]
MLFIFLIHSALCSVFYYNQGENKIFGEYIESKDNLVSPDKLYYGERINITLGEIVDYGNQIDPSDLNNYLCFLSIINDTYFVSEVEYNKFPWFSNLSEIYQQSIPELSEFTDNKHICSKIIYQDDDILIYCQIETTPEVFENFFIIIEADGGVLTIQVPGFNDQPISQLQYWPQQKIISQIQNGDITNFDESLDVVSILNLNGSITQLKNISNYQAVLFDNQLFLSLNNKNVTENINCKGKPKDVGGHIQNMYIACDQLYNFASDKYVNLNVSKIETTEYYLILDNKYVLDTTTNQYFTSQYPIYAAGYGDYALVVQKDGVYPVVINEISIFNPTDQLTVNDKIKFYPVDSGLMALNASKVFDEIPLSYEDFVYGPLPEIDSKSGLAPQFPMKIMFYKELTNIKAAIQTDEGLKGINQDLNNDLVLFACTLEFECGSQTIIDQNVKNISWAQFYIDDDNDVQYLAYTDNNQVKIYKNSKTKTLLISNYSIIAFDSNLLAIVNNDTLAIFYIDENAEYIALNVTYGDSIKQLVIDDYQVYVIFEKFYILYELSYDEYLDLIDAEYHDIPNITFTYAQEGQLVLFNTTSFQSLYDGYERGVYKFNFENKTFQRTSEFIYIYGQEQLIIMDPDMSQSLTGQLTYISRWNISLDTIFVEYDEHIILISNGTMYEINLDIKFVPISLNFSDYYYYKTQNTSLKFTNILNQSVSTELKYSSPVIPAESKGKLIVNITNGTGKLNIRDAFNGNIHQVRSDTSNVTVKQLYQQVKQFDKQVRDILTVSNQSLTLFDKNITTLNKSLPINISCSQLEAYLNGFLIICSNITIYVHSIELSNFTLHNISLVKDAYQINQQYIGILNNKSLVVRNLTNEIGTLKDVDSYTFDGLEVIVLRKNELSICDINLKCSQVFNLSTFGFEYTLVQSYKNKAFFIFTPKGINHLIKIDQDIQVVKSFSGSYKSIPFEIHVYGDILKVCYYDQHQISAYFYDMTTNSTVIPYISQQGLGTDNQCGKDYSNNSFLLRFEDSNTSQQYLIQYSVSNQIQLNIKSQAVKSFNLYALGDVTQTNSVIQLNYLSSNNVIVPKEKTSDDLILTILTAFVIIIVVILIIRQVRKWYLIRKMNQAGQAKPSEFNSEYL